MVLSLFGLVSAFAGAVIVEYKGYVHIAVGLLSMVFFIGSEVMLFASFFTWTEFGSLFAGPAITETSNPASS